MNKEFHYISDEALEQLMNQVEQKELVAAPPDLLESILKATGLVEEGVLQPVPVIPEKSVSSKKKEFYAYCFRVITSVAAAIALVFLLPELSVQMQRTDTAPEFNKQEVPSYEEVVDKVPSRDEVVLAGQTPTKEEVLNNAGFIERVLNNTGWFNKQHGED